MLKHLGQLIYTSFPGTGFQSLANAQVPAEIRAFFLKQVVLKHWNAYQPGQSCQQAIYLHQITPESTRVGWLYCDEVDEYERSIPYFISYHLAGPLNAENLTQMLDCLQRGPAVFFDRHRTNQSIDAIKRLSIEDYEPARCGLNIANAIYENSLACLAKGDPINVLLFEDEQWSESDDVNDSNIDQAQMPLDNVEQLRPHQPQLSQLSPSVADDTHELSEVLQDLIDKPLGVQCACLVSSTGQPMTAPVGMDETSALILSGAMIYLMQSTCEELQWQDVNKICIRAKEGHVVLAQCSSDVFLMLQADPMLMGLLDGEINRTVQKLQVVLQRHTDHTPSFSAPIAIASEPKERYLEAV